MRLEYPDGATPLAPDLLEALIPDLATQQELNEWEAQNIAAALRWALRSRNLRRDLLSVSGLTQLHRRMFDQTWHWAGKLRLSDTNIGVPWHQVSTQAQAICDDVHYQMQNTLNTASSLNTVYLWDELAARFHHRLVLIHPFPNGNGRHARLAADLLLSFHGQPMFTWGSASLEPASLVADSTVRQEYLAALREADRGSVERLLRFVRS